MSSKTEVYNLAAAAIGSGTRVTDPDDNTPIARSIAGVWDIERRATIRDGSWNFALVRKRLAALVDRPAFGFDFQFKLPAGCLRLIEVQVGGRQIDDYQLEAGKILSDYSGPLDVRVLVDVEEPAEWDDLFAATFARRIAWTIGTKIAGSNFDKDKVWREYQDGISASKRVDAMENPPIGQVEDDWIQARMIGSQIDLLTLGPC